MLMYCSPRNPRCTRMFLGEIIMMSTKVPPLLPSEVSWIIGIQILTSNAEKAAKRAKELLIANSILDEETATQYVKVVLEGPQGEGMVNLLMEVLEQASDVRDAYKQFEEARNGFVISKYMNA